jgi:hypothetical protein
LNGACEREIRRRHGCIKKTRRAWMASDAGSDGPVVTERRDDSGKTGKPLTGAAVQQLYIQ